MLSLEVAGGQCAGAGDGDGAIARERADGLAEAVEVEDRAGADRHCAAVGQPLAGAQRQGAGVDRGTAAVAVVPGQRQRAGARLGQATAAVDRLRHGGVEAVGVDRAAAGIHGDRPRAGEIECGTELKRAARRGVAQGQAAARRAQHGVARDRQRAVVPDHRAPAVAVGRVGQHQGAAAGDLDVACRGAVVDLSRPGRRGAGGDAEGRISRHRDVMAVAAACRGLDRGAVLQHQRAAAAQVAVRGDRQRAAAHRGAAAVGVGAGQDRRAGLLRHAAGVRDRRRERVSAVGVVEDELAACERNSCRADRAGGLRRAARIAADHHRRAGIDDENGGAAQGDGTAIADGQLAGENS